MRCRDIVEVYNRHKEADVPNTRIHRQHIYPMFKISLRTLNTILGLQIERELRSLEEEKHG